MSDEITDRLEAWGRRETFGALELGVVDPPPRLLAAVARARRWRMARRAVVAVAALSLAAWAGWEATRSGVAPASEGAPPAELSRRQQLAEQPSPGLAVPGVVAEDDEAADIAPTALSLRRANRDRPPESLILPWPMAKPRTPLPSMPPVTTRREPPPR